jgi:hypothetical protein
MSRRLQHSVHKPVRLLIYSLVIAGCAGCAGKPSAPPPLATTYVSTSGSPLAAAPMRADGTLDAEKLAEAKKVGYSLVNTNGERLYCRTDVKVGSHIRKNTDTVCLSAEQMIEIHEQTRHSLEQFVPFHMQCIATPGAPPC